MQGMSTLVQEDCTRCKISARIRTDLVQAACTKAVSQIQVSGYKKHVCGRHRCTKRRTGLVFYRLTCTSSAVRTVQKWALGTVLRAQEPPFVRHLYEKTALRGSESTPCTNRCKPDTSKFKAFQVPGLRSTVHGVMITQTQRRRGGAAVHTATPLQACHAGRAPHPGTPTEQKARPSASAQALSYLRLRSCDGSCDVVGRPAIGCNTKQCDHM